MSAPSALSASALIAKCVELYLSFQPAAVTVDAHSAECMSRWGLSADDSIFLSQVFYGVVRYKRLLGVLMAAFYSRNGSSASRDDVHLYTVFGYLALLRLQELTFAQLKRLVTAHDPQAMVVLLRFLFADGELEAVCRDEWLKLYDVPFVDGLLAGRAAFAADAASLVESLEQSVYLSRQRQQQQAEFWAAAAASTAHPAVDAGAPGPTGDGSPAGGVSGTSPPGQASGRGGSGRGGGAFALSSGRPRLPPPAEPPPPQFKARPTPPASQQHAKMMAMLQAKKAQTRAAAAAKYADPAHQPFTLHVLERPAHIDRVRAEVEAQRMAEVNRTRVSPRPAPPPPNASVRLNAAALLREDAAHRKKQAAAAAALARYVAELRDESEFETWRAAAVVGDVARRAAQVEARRMDMAAAYDAAVQAKAGTVDDKRAVVESMRAEAAALEAQLKAEEAEAEAANRRKRAAVLAGRDGARAAAEAIEAAKRASAAEMVAASADAARAAAAARAADAARKRDVIRRLRAADAVKDDDLHRVTTFDPTSTQGLPGVGTPVHMLQEMSLLELRERLAAAGKARAESVADAKAAIGAQRAAREASLAAAAARLSRARDVASAQAAARKAAAVAAAATAESAAATRREGAMVTLQATLESRRAAGAAERDRLAEEEKRVKFEQSGLSGGHASVEAKRFVELRAGAARQLRVSQHGRKADAELKERTSAEQRAETLRAARAAAAERSARGDAYDADLAEATARGAGQAAAEAAAKAGAVRAGLESEATLRRLWREAHPSLVALGSDGFGLQRTEPLVWTHADGADKYPPKARPSPTMEGIF